MAKDRLITIIDVGSSKIVCLIAEHTEDDTVQIIGVSSIPSRGIKKGVIVDIDQAVEVLSESLESAERMAGVTVSRVWVSVNGSHISSVNSQGVVAVSSPEGEITPSDVGRVIEAAKAVSMPSSREVVHVIPRTFIVDQQEGIDDPIGMSGVRLQVETHIISGASTSIRNLVKSVQEVGLDVENLIFTGLASSESLLTDTEKELGVVLVDIGGGTTDLMVFHEGAPVYSSVLKLGGKNITSDIAVGLRVPLEDAEKIKRFVSMKKPQETNPRDEHNHREDGDEVLDISTLNLESLQKVDKKFLVEGVMAPRLEELAEEVAQELKKSGFDGMTPAGLVIGGGVSYTAGIKKVFEDELRLPVRLAQPSGVSGLIDEIRGADYAASVGSILYALNSSNPGRSLLPSLPGIGISFDKVSKVKDKALGFIKSLIP
ncbi:cell division protein FtsA [candidate division WWE3 bacterium]|uniref:Cell division protein FtsA n=1 Tax=candidate division WWE3 bacterium TaxID=2053526 RepID=A0A955LKZ6_UNCKA|nr:cell division protein FtsA [candidate division WWE3 bacterium]